MTDMDEVRAAAAFLDANVGDPEWLTTDWRSKIDVPKLDMGDIMWCVLGQIHPSSSNGYDDASDDLYGKSGWNRDWFCGYGEAWREYLSGTHMADGSEWVTIHDGADKNIRIVGCTFKSGDVKYVTYQILGSSRWYTVQAESFLRDFKPKPKPRFVKGDQLMPERGATRFYYVTDEKVIRVGNGQLSWGDLAFFEHQEGTLTKCSYSNFDHYFGGEFFK